MPLTPAQAAAEVERHACATCGAPAGRACRTRGGKTAHRYHTARFILVAELQNTGEVLVPAERAPGRPWPLEAPLEAPSTVEPTGVLFRVGYAHTAPADRAALRTQLDALQAVGCQRVFTEIVSPPVKARPELDNALRLAAAHRPAVLTVVELKRVARNASELMAVAGVLRGNGSRLELLTGPLAGNHPPDSALFTVLAACAELDRDHLREKTRGGQRTAAAQGRPAGRPRALDGDMLALARSLRDDGLSVPDIVNRLTITAGKNAGRRPSLASVYRALGGGAASSMLAQEAQHHDVD
jgi:DNA invertase Pin-like site-specific DNA recombinase